MEKRQMGFQETDAPVLFVFGQSNAHGNGARLPESEKIAEPKKIKTPPARGAGGEVSADIDKIF